MSPEGYLWPGSRQIILVVECVLMTATIREQILKWQS